MLRRSNNLNQAAARYRVRRGRHPPPGFNAWWAYAKKHDAIIVEDFFDRIYDDLAPFWVIPQSQFRPKANRWHHIVRVRTGKADGVGDATGRVNWLELWTNLVAEFAEHLPDVDMPINYMDEPRVVVP